jgi:hypothetical protein
MEVEHVWSRRDKKRNDSSSEPAPEAEGSTPAPPPKVTDEMLLTFLLVTVHDGRLKVGPEGGIDRSSLSNIINYINVLLEGHGPVADGHLWALLHSRNEEDKGQFIRGKAEFYRGKGSEKQVTSSLMDELIQGMKSSQATVRDFYPDPKTGRQLRLIYEPHKPIYGKSMSDDEKRASDSPVRGQDRASQGRKSGSGESEAHEHGADDPVDLAEMISPTHADPALEERVILGRLEALLKAHPERVDRLLGEVIRLIEEYRPAEAQHAGTVPETAERVLGTREAAEYLGKRQITIQKAAQAGLIGEFISGRYLFSAAELDAFDQREKSRGGRPRKNPDDEDNRAT